MSRLNLSIFLASYSDKKSSNAPVLSNFKWNRDVNGIDAENPSSQTFTVPAGQSVTLFDQVEAKKLVYIESDQEVELTLDNVAQDSTLKPIVINDSKFPAVFLQSSDIKKVEINNPGTEDAVIFLITVE